MTKCETCSSPSTVNCVWGLYEHDGKPRTEPMQSADLCKQCSDDLWQRVRGAVNAGLMHWTNKPVSK